MYLLRKSSKNFAHIQEKSKIFIYFQHNAHHAHISNTETQKKDTLLVSFVSSQGLEPWTH